MAWSIPSSYRSRLGLVLTICLVLAAVAYADRGSGGYGGWHGGGGGWGKPGGYDDDNDDNNNDSNDNDDGDIGVGGGGGTNNGNGGGNGQFGAIGFDINEAARIRNIHGIVAMVAMAGLFPLGSILMRILPGKLALWVHGLFQLLALGVYIAAAGLGIYLARMVNIPGEGNLLQNEATRYHPIIGLVILAVFLLQPVFGYVHHKKYKRLLRRQFWSYLHIFNGRVAITVGIINGGLGLRLANASASRQRAYIILAAIMWTLWMVVAIVSEIIRMRRTRAPRTAAAPPAAAKVASTEARRSED